MARAFGSVGITKRSFETDFLKYCDENQFSPGAECAKLMHCAAQKQDAREFVMLGMLHAKMTAPIDTGAEQNALPLVIDRRRDAA